VSPALILIRTEKSIFDVEQELWGQAKHEISKPSGAESQNSWTAGQSLKLLWIKSETLFLPGNVLAEGLICGSSFALKIKSYSTTARVLAPADIPE